MPGPGSLLGDVAKVAARATASAPSLDPSAAFPVDTQKLRRFLDHCSLPPSFELAFAVSQRARADMQHAWKESDVSVGAVHFRHDHDGQMAVRAMLIKPNKELTKLYKAVETLEHEALQARDAMSREVIDLVGKLNVAASKISTSYEEELSAVRHEAQASAIRYEFLMHSCRTHLSPGLPFFVAGDADQLAT